MGVYWRPGRSGKGRDYDVYHEEQIKSYVFKYQFQLNDKRN